MKLPKVYYKNLKKVWGWSYNDKNKIELSKKLKGKKHLEILTHEHLHLLLPAYDEEWIKEMAKAMSEILWRQGYRRKLK
jgi:hypothetical protein